MQPCSGLPSNKTERERENVECLWTSREFVNLWEELLHQRRPTHFSTNIYHGTCCSIGSRRRSFQQELEKYLQKLNLSQKRNRRLSVTCTAGFIPHHSLLKKLSKSTHPKKEELCLNDTEDEASISQQ